MLIPLLQEASGHDISDLKKVLSKDKRINQVLTKNLDIENISNKAEFLSTLKFFVLNNRNVINFVNQRSDIKSLNSRVLKKLRELRAQDLKQTNIDELTDFVSTLFREYSHVEKSGISAETRKELVDWANKDGRYFNLSRSAQHELSSVPGLRPTRPILLYRGLLFNGYDLKERKRYDGQLEVGRGLKFLRSIRDGSRVIDLEWDKASSWTTDKQVALNFAKYSAASSSYEATLSWLSRSSKKEHIDGELGFVISTLAQPEDVLIDLNRLVTKAHLKHGNESEIILKPGKYTCRLNTKFTKSGEVDPDAKDDSKVDNLIEEAKKFLNELNEDLSEFKIDGWQDIRVEHLDFNDISKLSSSDTKALTLEEFAKIKKFYHDHLDAFQNGDLESLVGSKDSRIIDWLITLRKVFLSSVSHQDFKIPGNSSGRGLIKDLAPEKYRETKFSETSSALSKLKYGVRFTDSQMSYTVNKLAKILEIPQDNELHRKGKDAQTKFIDEIINRFYEKSKLSKPEDAAESLKKIRNFFLTAERTAGLINEINRIRNDLKEAVFNT